MTDSNNSSFSTSPLVWEIIVQKPYTCSFDAEEPIPEIDVFLYLDEVLLTESDDTYHITNFFTEQCSTCSFTYQLFIDGIPAATDPVEDGTYLVLNVAGSGLTHGVSTTITIQATDTNGADYEQPVILNVLCHKSPTLSMTQVTTTPQNWA